MFESVLQAPRLRAPSAVRRSSGTIAAGLAALIFGVVLVVGAGFAGPQVLHNAAHDARHAMGFPCH